MMHRIFPFRVLALATCLTLLGGLAVGQDKKGGGKKKEELPVGLSRTLFEVIPDDQSKEAIDSMQKLVRVQTGLKGEFTTVDDLMKMSEQLSQGKHDLGVFVGHEYA